MEMEDLVVDWTLPFCSVGMDQTYYLIFGGMNMHLWAIWGSAGHVCWLTAICIHIYIQRYCIYIYIGIYVCVRMEFMTGKMNVWINLWLKQMRWVEMRWDEVKGDEMKSVPLILTWWDEMKRTEHESIATKWDEVILDEDEMMRACANEMRWDGTKRNRQVSREIG